MLDLNSWQLVGHLALSLLLFGRQLPEVWRRLEGRFQDILKT